MPLTLKYRTWDKSRLCWSYFDDVAVSPVTPGENYQDGATWESSGPDGHLEELIGDNDNLIHQLFTGAQDADNKEIYEGDILSWSEYQGFDIGTTIQGIYIVEWHNDGLKWICHDPISGDKVEMGDCNYNVVIGNIFENPNLITVIED